MYKDGTRGKILGKILLGICVNRTTCLQFVNISGQNRSWIIEIKGSLTISAYVLKGLTMIQYSEAVVPYSMAPGPCFHNEPRVGICKIKAFERHLELKVESRMYKPSRWRK